ncbi:hypothetical protein DL96DRAFT_1610932 [Flagelloscypha sp. PMI_526]|nr:hypothetical protein DL96DRAFT_1610932 [Flagelloscypha sp. PMI_526]
MLSSTGYPFYLLSSFRNLPDFLFGGILSLQHVQPRNLKGFTVIVTGANTGIGLEATRSFASFGATVIMACRNQSKGDDARQTIIHDSKGEILPEQLEVELLDLGDLDSVRTFIEAWGDRPLNILFNNAGVTLGKYSKSPQGFQLSYVTNILSHYLLTLSLLPTMRPGGRIINVCSVASYDAKSKFDPTDLDYARHLEQKLGIKVGDDLPLNVGLELYRREKLLQIYFTREMQLRLERSDQYKKKLITVHCYHPGIVKSAIWTRSDGLQTSMESLVNKIGVPPTEGAATGVYLAIDQDYVPHHAGLYWYRMGIRGANRSVEDANTRAIVWDRMADETKLIDSLRL